MLSEEQVEEYTKQFGRVKYVTFNGVDLVFRKPKRVECQQYASRLGNPQEKLNSDEQLAQQLVVHCNGMAGALEARKALTELLEEYPFMIRSEVVGQAISRLMGLTQDDVVKTYGST